jgi:dTDP-4-dehydrorhamnose 3,5-epimerase
MRLVSLGLPGLLLVESRVFSDVRGSFLETWNGRALAAAGLEATFVQDNMSLSNRHALRGLHYQARQPQGKLIRVVSGAVFDVVVDLRRSSPAFGRAFTLELEADKHQALWVPPGFAHGFLSLADDTRVQYKVTDYWAPEWERTLAWDDPALGISWPLPAGGTPIVSDKDRAGTPLAAADTYP